MAHWLRALVTLVEDTSLTSVTHMASHDYLVLPPVPVFGLHGLEAELLVKKKKAAGNE